MSDTTNKNKHQRGIVDFLFDEIRAAIQDSREKVVDEGWFDRVVTPGPTIEAGDNQSQEIGGSNPNAQREWVLGRQPTVEELMAERAPSTEQNPAQQRERDGLER